MQKARTVLFLISAFSLFLLPSLALAEKITSYDIAYTINEDATVGVVETIEYDFEAEERHGIFRTLIMENASGNTMKMRDVVVVNESGEPYMVEVSGRGTKAIKIGDPNMTITGTHTYVISYTLDHALSYYDDFDELYFDAIGTEWYIPIEKAQVSIVLPKDASGDTIQYYCYAGYYGDTTPCESAVLADKGAGLEVKFAQTTIGSGLGLSVAVGFPKGLVPYVKPPIDWKEIANKVSVVLFVCMLVWIVRLRIKRRWGRMTIVTEYEAPKDISPFLVGAFIDEKVQPRDITALLITLASRGVLSIREIDKKGLLSQDDYELTIEKTVSESGLSEVEKELLEAYFGTIITKAEKLLLSSLKSDTALPAKIAKIKEIVFEDMVTRGYYEKSPLKTKAAFIGAGLLMTFLGFQLGFLIGGGFVLLIAGSGILMLVFGAGLTRKTTKGRELRRALLGYKRFLEMTEKDRLDFHQAPERKPEEFFSYLPYAIAFGVEKKWAAQFGDMSLSNPSWYQGSSSTFTPAVFVSSFGDFSPSFGKSQNSGGIGSGGGGFSGGGGGGGGGGSW